MTVYWKPCKKLHDSQSKSSTILQRFEELTLQCFHKIKVELQPSKDLNGLNSKFLHGWVEIELRFHKGLKELHLKEVLQDEVSTLHEVDTCEILEHWVEKLVLYK